MVTLLDIPLNETLNPEVVRLIISEVQRYPSQNREAPHSRFSKRTDKSESGFTLRRRTGRAMAGGAIFRSGFVEENSLSGDNPCQFVTFGTAHVLVRPSEGKVRPFVMIEKRRLPLHAVVTFSAAGDIYPGKLISVDVFMAVLALHWSSLEVHVDQLGFKARRLMAIDAGRRTVCPKQRELCFRVIEPR